MGKIPNFITVEYTEPDKGEIINYAYHDFVMALDGFQTYDEQYDLTNFKYVMVIYVDGIEVATLKAPKEKNKSYGLFNFRPIVEDFVKTDEGGYDFKFGNIVINSTKLGNDFMDVNHSIHEIDKFARNRDNLIQVTYTIGCTFYNLTTQQQDTSIQVFPKFDSKANFLPYYYFWNGVLQHHRQQQGFKDYKFYMLNGTGKQFLTNKQPNCKREVVKTDYETLAFFNGVFRVNISGHGHGSTAVSESSAVADIYIKAYGDSSFNMIIPNNDANGGSYNPIFQSQFLIPNNPTFSDEGLLYVGVGPKNIIDNGLNDTGGNPVTSTTFDGVNRYEVWARDILGTRISKIYNFDVIEENCTYERIRIAYLNRMGAWDYINFRKKSTRTTDITRSNYMSGYGYLPLQYNNVNQNNKWEYGSYEGGTRSYNVNAIQNIEANTDFLNEADAEALEQLFTSPVAYIQRSDAKFEPVLVTEKDYLLQTTDNDKLKQYIVNIQYGHQTRVQRL